MLFSRSSTLRTRHLDLGAAHVDMNLPLVGFIISNFMWCFKYSNVLNVILFPDRDFLCGGILIEPNGTILSPDRDFDGVYESNLDCPWLLIAPEGKIIQLIFKYSVIESSEICEFDRAEVGIK